MPLKFFRGCQLQNFHHAFWDVVEAAGPEGISGSRVSLSACHKATPLLPLAGCWQNHQKIKK